MIQITDEILNKYLDGELNREQAEQVKSALRNSEELQRKFNALKLVNDRLSLITEDEVSPGFTNKLMKQIVNRSTVPKQQKYFIASVATFITLLCLVIFGFSISAMISATSSSIGDSRSVFDSVSGLSEGLVNALQHLFSGAGLSIIGSIFSIVVLISGYFFFEMQKRSKANLGNGQHL
jgi:predicted anti-sigma-YlaC factor YlaD